MQPLKLSELQYSESSLIDPVGRVFFYLEQPYRAINRDYEAYVREFIVSELFSILTKLHYIPNTSIADNIEVEGIPLVLRHEKCFISKAHEWTFDMLKDATIFILKLNSLCNSHGYELKDGHTGNITFHNGRPIFIDFGSIVKKENPNSSWIAEQEFVQHFVLPLLLWSNNEGFIARALLESKVIPWKLQPQLTIWESSIMGNYLHPTEHFLIKRRNKIFSTNNPLLIGLAHLTNYLVKIFYKRLRKEYRFFYIEQAREWKHFSIDFIESLSTPSIQPPMGDYHIIDGNNADGKRFDRIIELVKEYCPSIQSAVDIASNAGVFAKQLISNHVVSHVFALDYDLNAINIAYQDAKQQSLPLDPIWINAICPSNPIDTSSRLKSDIAVALAITHHLLLTQNYNISITMERIAAYSKRYVAIEFMPLGLYDGESAPTPPQWYTEKWFQSEFEKRFYLLHKEKLEDNRIIYIGEKMVCSSKNAL